MALRIRKNNKANNALAGLERGLGNGFQMGMEARRTRLFEDREARNEERAIREAQRIDQEMQRENTERGAAQEAVGAMAQAEMPEREIPASGGTPFGGPAQVGRPDPAAMQRREKWARIGEIAKRMDPKTALTFLSATKEREKEAITEQNRVRVRRQFETMLGDGSFKLEQDESGVQSPEEMEEAQSKLDASIEQIQQAVAGEDFNPDQVQNQIAKLTSGLVKSDARKQFRMGKIAQLDADVAALGQPGPDGTPPQGSPAIRNAQAQKLLTMKNAYKRAAWAFDDPKAMAKFEAEWADTMAGVADRDGIKIPLDQVQKYDARERARVEEKHAADMRESAMRAKWYGEREKAGASTRSPDTAIQKEIREIQDKVIAGDITQEDGAAMLKSRGVEPAQAAQPGPDAGPLKDIPDKDLRAKGIEMGRALVDAGKGEEAQALARALLAEMKRRGIK